MTFEHYPVDPTTFKTIPEEQCHLNADEGCKPETALACGTVECKA